MPQLEVVPIVDGSAYSGTFTLLDAAGNPIVYAEGDTLSAAVSVGETRAPIFTPTVAWDTEAEGTVNYSHTNAQGALFVPDTDYTVYLSITRGSYTVTRKLFLFRVEALPALGAAPITYATPNDVLLYAGDVIQGLSDSSDQGGYSEQLAEAARWTRKTILSRAESLWDRSGFGHLGTDRAWLDVLDTVVAAGDVTYSPLKEDFLAVVRSYLEADEDGNHGLLIDPETDSDIIAANALYAVSLVFARQVGTSGTFFQETNEYQKLAALWHGRAVAKLMTSTFRLDPERDGSIILRLDP